MTTEHDAIRAQLAAQVVELEQELARLTVAVPDLMERLALEMMRIGRKAGQVGADEWEPSAGPPITLDEFARGCAARCARWALEPETEALDKAEMARAQGDTR